MHNKIFFKFIRGKNSTKGGKSEIQVMVDRTLAHNLSYIIWTSFIFPPLALLLLIYTLIGLIYFLKFLHVEKRKTKKPRLCKRGLLLALGSPPFICLGFS